jgi:DHA1 family bicyclomycin/chloramphenicol resistance-like MFS transporter
MSKRQVPPFLILVTLLTSLAALGQISVSLYTPSLPAMAIDLKASPEQVNLTLGVFFFGFSFSQLVYGPLSDRFGRRPILFIGIAIYAVASLTCVFATSIEALIALRFCQALGSSAGPVLARAVVRDLHGGDRAAQVMAYVGIGFAVVPALLPTLGGYLQTWFGWEANFLFLTGIATLIGLAVWIILPETNERPDPTLAVPPQALLSSYKMLITNSQFLGYMLMVGGVFAGLMAMTAAAPFLLIGTLGISPEKFGLLMASTVIGFLGGTLVAGKLAPRLGIPRMALIGASLAVIGGLVAVLLALANYFNPAAVIGPMLIYLAGLGFVMPSGMAGAMEPHPRIAGTASALMGCFQMLSATAGSIIAGHLSHQTQIPVSILILVCAVIAFLGLIFLARPHRKGSTPSASL